MTICINDDKLLNKVPKIIPIINKKNKFVFSLLNIILNKNNELSKNKIKILDATYNCANYPEDIYQDDKYIYYFDCAKSGSVYVKLSDGKKMLVTTALEEEKVTIEELIAAGLKVSKKEK